MENKKLVFSFMVILLAVFIAATYLFNQNQKNKLEGFTKKDEAPFVRENAISFGENRANVVIVEFFDPECESCQAFYPAVKEVYKQYYKDIKLVIRYLANHKNSAYIIKVLEATRLQNKYIESLEVIFKYQTIWANHNDPQPELVWQYLPEAGLDMKKLKEDFLKLDVSSLIKEGFEDAKALGVRGTPTFFVNGKELQELSYQALLDLVEKEIFEKEK